MNDKQLQLVSHEQAVKLKKAGFSWDCETFYSDGNLDNMHNLINHNTNEGYDGERGDYYDNFGEDDLYCSAPTIQHALKWFRDTKGLNAFCDNKYHRWHYDIYSIGNDAIRIDGNELQIFFETYEDAESALLDRLLNLLESEK